jgi:hydroxypyruvate reductase
MNPDFFWTTSLRAAPGGAAVTRILAAALAAVEPGAAVRRWMRRAGDQLLVGQHAYDLSRYDRVFLVGAGKAGVPMAHAAAEALDDRLTGGVVVVKEGYTGGLQLAGAPQSAIYNLQLVEASHPVPDERGLAAVRQMSAMLAGLTERDLVITLISGGGSALLTLPIAGVGLADLQVLTALLLRSGASINEINQLRKHIDQVKGGGLARMIAPATLAALILSDVVGDPLDVIASGPTVPDSSSFADAYAVLERYNIVATTPPSILDHLRRGLAGMVAETPKAGEPCFDRATTSVVGSNAQAAQAAVAAAQAEGFNTLLLTTYLQGEAREVGRVLAAVGRELATHGQPLPRPACIVVGGETTVTLRGAGIGGRNQELALAAVADLAGLADIGLITLATDGGDGPTDAAGAVVTGATLDQARRAGLDAAAHLARNDAYPFFAALGDLLRPGPTHTNVNDLALICAF